MSNNFPYSPEDHETKEGFNKAVLKGAYVGAGVGFGSSLAGVLAASRLFPRFANQPIQLKVLLITFITSAGFAFGGEKATFHTPYSTFYKYYENRKKEATDDSSTTSPTSTSTSSASTLQSVVTYIRSHRTALFLSTGTAAIGASVVYFMRHKHLSWSQKLGQTRIFAQATILGTIVAMGVIEGLSDHLKNQELKLTGKEKVIEVSPHPIDNSKLGPAAENGR